jgi:hypothetical protein
MSFVGILLFIGLLVVRCRRSAKENEEGYGGRGRMNNQEFQGLLREYDDFDDDLKMK